MKKIFITGIEGFVGKYLFDELIKDNEYEIHGLCHKDSCIKHLEGLNLKLYPSDIVVKEELYSVLDKVRPDIIVHLAAISFVPHAMKDPLGTWNINLFGTLHILEWVRDKSIDTKVLIVSSGEVYGAPESSDALPFTERTLLNPANVYSATKASMDIAARQYVKTWGLNVVIARPFNHIGPGQADIFVVSSFARQVAEIKKGLKENVIRVGNLSAARDFTDVRDVVRAYRLILANDLNGVYNISSGDAVKIQYILDSLIRYADTNAKVEVDPARLRPVDVPEIYGSSSKLTEHTSWSREYSIEDSLNDTLNYWLDVL